MTLLGLACGVALAEGLGRVAMGSGGTRADAPRASSVREIPNKVDRLPAPEPDRPSLLLIGNSHTYSLPGKTKGEPARADSGATLIDELGKRVAARLSPEAEPIFYRLAYPNLLPMEMLLRVGQLLHAGYRPELVVLGLTYRNVARDSRVRPEIEELAADTELIAWLRHSIDALGTPAARRVVRALDAEVARLAGRESRALGQSHADRLDERLTRGLGAGSVLLGESAELRARVYRSVVHFLGSRLRRGDRRFTYAAIEGDYAQNFACLESALRLLRANGSRLVVYFAPERSDVPPLVDPSGRPEFARRVRELGVEIGAAVLDAENVVPAEYWGWDRDTPDQSHFTERGHRLLADFIVNGAPEAWTALARGAP
jgi:hypothetical protein